MRPKEFQDFTRDVRIPGCNLRALYSGKFGTEGILNKICEILESNRSPYEIQNLTVLVDFTPPTRQVDSFLSLGDLSDGRFRSV